MKQTFLALSATVAALALAPTANAAVVDPILLSGNPSTDSFGGVVGDGAFSDVFNFTVPSDSSASGSAISTAIDIGGVGDLTFTSVVLDGLYTFNILNINELSVALLSKTSLLAGSHFLTVEGTSIGESSYGGNFNIAPIPEPATWAMMIAGFGLAGVALRRRSAAARNVAVSFV